MVQLSAGVAAPDPVHYMDVAAGTAVGAAYKQRFLTGLGVELGQSVVDIGCGPGTDLARLADAVGGDGSVLGIDREPRMVAEARRRLAGRTNVEFAAGDIHQLPLGDGSIDRIRVDRVLQHVLAPAKAIAEARRVLRSGGLFGMAEPDWDTLVVADEDLETSRRFSRFVAGRVRNPTMGRDLVRLCVQAGLTVSSLDPRPILFRDFETADQIVGLHRNAARAVQAGEIAEGAAEAWLQRLATAPVVVGFTFYLVIAQA